MNNDTVEISFSDVIHLIQQFLAENNLFTTFEQLQSESGIRYKSISNVQQFLDNINHGKWDLVLQSIEPLDIEPIKLMDLYEQIVLEMIECREIGVARTMLYSSAPFQVMKENDEDRHNFLCSLMQDPSPSFQEIWGKESKDHKRSKIGMEIMKLVTIAPAHRLLDLLKDAVHFQKDHGSIPNGKFDLFLGRSREIFTKKDEIIAHCKSSVRVNSDDCVEAVEFSPNGEMMVFGFQSGKVEFWNFLTGIRRTDIIFEQQQTFIQCLSSIISLSFNYQNELLAVGEMNGNCSIFSIVSGKCIASIKRLHSRGITSISWNRDSSQFCTSSYDGHCKIIGTKTFVTLKEFRCHNSYILSCCFSFNEKNILTTGSDGLVRLWDVKNAECLFSFSPRKSTEMSAVSLISLLPVQGNAANFIVCSNDKVVYEFNSKGKFSEIVAIEESSFLNCTVSYRCEFLYAITTDSSLLTISLKSKKVLHRVKVSNDELVSLKMHPFMNVLIVTDVKGLVYFYHPAH